MPAEDSGVLTLLVVCSSPHSTPCRPLPSNTNSVYNDIERGRSWTSQSSLGGRKSRSLGMFSLSVSVPQCGGCVTV